MVLFDPDLHSLLSRTWEGMNPPLERRGLDGNIARGWIKTTWFAKLLCRRRNCIFSHNLSWIEKGLPANEITEWVGWQSTV